MAGIFLLVMSLSGSILVFHDEIDNAIYKRQCELKEPIRSLSFVASFEKVRQENRGWEIRVPALPESNQALTYELRNGNERKWIFVHPETGEILV